MLILFVGLALDAGNVYINYGHLKRSVDSAAVAAANAYRGNTSSEDYATRLAKIQGAAVETIALDGLVVEPGTTKGLKTGVTYVEVYTCSSTDDGVRDLTLATTKPEFYEICPDTSIGEDPRKLVWVEATLEVPLYFLQLLGIYSIPLTTHTVSEASPLDLIIVLDTSGSMAHDTVEQLASSTPGFNPGDFDPSACIAADNCQPLKGAKDAAEELIGTLYQGYDKVNIITYDLYARSVTNGFTDVTTAKTALTSSVKLHYDPPFYRIWTNWTHAPVVDGPSLFNPTNPEDFDGDGQDGDNFFSAAGLNYGSFIYSGSTYNGCPSETNITDFSSAAAPWAAYQLRWWDGSGLGDKNPGMEDDPRPPTSWANPYDLDSSNNWKPYGGAPCDDGTLFDSYNWEKTALYADTPTIDFDADANDQAIRDWMTDADTTSHEAHNPNSTNQLALKSFLCNPSDLTSLCFTQTIQPDNLLPVSEGGKTEALSDHWQQRAYHDVAGRLLSQMTTCVGCAVRQAYVDFNNYGRDDSTWVMVFLSDGTANATDRPEQNDEFFYTYSGPPSPTSITWNIGQHFPNGFCAGRATGTKGLWDTPYCVEANAPTVAVQGSTRYCVNEEEETCPPDYYGPGPTGVHVEHLSETDLDSYANQIKYGPVQYAMDMTDMLSLTKRKSGLVTGDLGYNEAIRPFGDKSVSIFTIGFGKTDILATYNGQAIGENLLRYMASVGDDGDRQTDPCYNSSTNSPIAPWTSCGNYYYAPDANELNRVFEDIAKRVQTKLSY